MKLNNLVFDNGCFAAEMAKLRDGKHFDYLVIRPLYILPVDDIADAAGAEGVPFYRQGGAHGPG